MSKNINYIFLILISLYYYIVGALIEWQLAGSIWMHSMTIFLIILGSIKLKMHGISHELRGCFKYILIVGFIMTIYTFVFLDIADTLQVLSWFGTFAAYILIFQKYRCKHNLLYVLIYFSFIAFFVYIILGWDILLKPIGNGNTLTIFPSKISNPPYIINIGYPGSTSHLMASLFGIFSTLQLARLINRETISTKDSIFFLISLYMVLFTGSRSVYMALLSVVLIVWHARKYNNLLWSWIIILICTISIYGTGLLELSTSIVGQSALLKTSNEDLTSGRAWLWAYHLDVFYHHPFGGGRKSIAELIVGDVLNGEVVKASSESFYTSLLAVYGIFSIAFLLFFIWPTHWALKNRNYQVLGLMIFVLIGTAANSLFANTYGFIQPFIITFCISKISTSLPKRLANS